MTTPLQIELEIRTEDHMQPFNVTLPSSEHEQFYFDLRHKGYALLKLPDQALEAIAQLRAYYTVFFGESDAVKNTYYDANSDAGYMQSRGVKETFQIRHVPGFAAWPSPALAEVSTRAYLLFDALARACLRALVEQHLRETDELHDNHVTGDLRSDHVPDSKASDDVLDPEQLVSKMLDPLSAPWSNSCLNVFHYTQPHSTGCVPHVDGGLLTLIPGTAESGLELYSALTRDWRAGPRDHSICLVLLGETIARLTRDTLTATCHRVLTEQPRMSTVFKQRARLELIGARTDSETRVLSHLMTL